MVVFCIDSVVGIPVFFIHVIFRYYLGQLASIIMWLQIDGGDMNQKWCSWDPQWSAV